VRITDGQILGTFSSGGSNPYGVAFDGSSTAAAVWVSNNSSNTVTKLRATDGALLGTFAVGSSPAGIVFASVP
jgi:DNA-binding beta-propeller fold protein YncE